jgi:hypothetical protein
MSPDKASLQKIFDELISMRKRQEEDRFLSKIDSMFTILVSIMIFMMGYVINNALTQGIVNFPVLFFGLSAIFLFIVVLVGQLASILQDNIGLRFYFWAIFINGIVQVPVQAVSIFLMGLTNNTLIWWPINAPTLILLPYYLMKLEKRYFSKFSKDREITPTVSFLLFYPTSGKRSGFRSRESTWYRVYYFFLVFAGVRLLLELPRFVLINFFLT